MGQAILAHCQVETAMHALPGCLCSRAKRYHATGPAMVEPRLILCRRLYAQDRLIQKKGLLTRQLLCLRKVKKQTLRKDESENYLIFYLKFFFSIMRTESVVLLLPSSIRPRRRYQCVQLNSNRHTRHTSARRHKLTIEDIPAGSAYFPASLFSLNHNATHVNHRKLII